MQGKMKKSLWKKKKKKKGKEKGAEGWKRTGPISMNRGPRMDLSSDLGFGRRNLD